MNRRRLLQAGATVGSVALAGCVDGVAEHFTGGVQGVIPMEIHSDATEPRNLHIEAHDRETDQQIYEEGITVGPGESAYPSHLRGTDQFLRIARIDTDEETEIDSEQVSVTEDTRVVLVYISDDEIDVELSRGEDDRETIDDPEDAETVADDEGERDPDDDSASSNDDSVDPDSAADGD